MKTFYALLMAMTLLISSNVFAIITAPYSNSYDSAGALTHVDKTWIKVKNGTGSSISRGFLVVPDVASDDGAVIKLPTASIQSQHAQCMMDEVCADGKVCKCQKYGYTDQLRFDGATSAVAGQGFYIGSATAGMAVYVATGNQSGWYRKLGVFFDASSSLGQVEALLDM